MGPQLCEPPNEIAQNQKKKNDTQNGMTPTKLYESPYETDNLNNLRGLDLGRRLTIFPFRPQPDKRITSKPASVAGEHELDHELDHELAGPPRTLPNIATLPAPFLRTVCVNTIFQRLNFRYGLN